MWREVAETKVTVATEVGGMVMHAVIRNYSGKGAKKLIDVVERKTKWKWKSSCGRLRVS